MTENTEGSVNMSPNQGTPVNEPKSETQEVKDAQEPAKTNDYDVKSLMAEIEAEEKARLEATAKDKQADREKLKTIIKDTLKTQKEETGKLKSDYESKITELTTSIEELKSKMDNTSEGSKKPLNLQSNDVTQATPTKMETAINYWADQLKNWKG